MTKYKGIVSTEAEQQKQLIAWCNTMSLYKGYEDLALIYHCPNGGSRNKLEAMNLKCEGVKPGVPDLFLPVARGGFFGLYIEMKWGKNKTTDLQNKWLTELANQGYYCVVCRGFAEAREELEKYIVLARTQVQK